MKLVFLWAATLLHVILFVVSCLQQGALDRRRDKSATRLEVIFHRKGFLPILDPSNLTCRKAYKTRVKGIWRFVENESINCPFLKTKWLRMYLLNLKFKTQINVETFSRKFTLQTWQSCLFFNLICRLLRMEKRSEDGSEMASSSTKLFKASCASQLKFFIIFGILPLSLPNVPLTWLEQTEYDFCFHGSIFFKL